jgi:hypothetical protein
MILSLNLLVLILNSSLEFLYQLVLSCQLVVKLQDKFLQHLLKGIPEGLQRIITISTDTMDELVRFGWMVVLIRWKGLTLGIVLALRSSLYQFTWNRRFLCDSGWIGGVMPDR